MDYSATNSKQPTLHNENNSTNNEFVDLPPVVPWSSEFGFKANQIDLNYYLKELIPPTPTWKYIPEAADLRRLPAAAAASLKTTTLPSKLVHSRKREYISELPIVFKISSLAIGSWKRQESETTMLKGSIQFGWKNMVWEVEEKGEGAVRIQIKWNIISQLKVVDEVSTSGIALKLSDCPKFLTNSKSTSKARWVLTHDFTNGQAKNQWHIVKCSSYVIQTDVTKFLEKELRLLKLSQDNSLVPNEFYQKENHNNNIEPFLSPSPGNPEESDFIFSSSSSSMSATATNSGSMQLNSSEENFDVYDDTEFFENLDLEQLFHGFEWD